MKALVYYGDHKIALEERPKPTIIKPTDVIVKVLKTTICGTDLGIYKYGFKENDYTSFPSFRTWACLSSVFKWCWIKSNENYYQ